MRDKTFPTHGGHLLTRHSNIITGDVHDHPSLGKPTSGASSIFDGSSTLSRGLGLGGNIGIPGGFNGQPNFASRIDTKDTSLTNICLKVLYGGVALILEKITVGLVKIAHTQLDRIFNSTPDNTKKEEACLAKDDHTVDKLPHKPILIKSNADKHDHAEPLSIHDHISSGTQLGGEDALPVGIY